MPRFRTGVVSRILEQRADVMRVVVTLGNEPRRATVFTRITGTVSEGDSVVVNTTGVDLELGTGGDDFVIWNLAHGEAGELSGGHILKLRYTPWQIDTMSAEAPESPHHDLLAEETSIEGMNVVACGLHSQVAAGAAVARHLRSDARIVYIMTDGAALPIAHSNLVASLKSKGVIDTTITCGHAFGGDLECVNVFSALATAKWVCEADIAFVAMGPGMVGTKTYLGHTEMEQGQVLNAVWAMGGVGTAALRISFAESRDRHRVVSHHSIAALRFAASSVLAVPLLERGKTEEVMAKLTEAGLDRIHDLRMVDAHVTFEALKAFDLAPETMGRTVQDDPDFFLAAGAAGIVAVQLTAQES